MTTFSLPQEHTLWLNIKNAASVGLICTDASLKELIIGYLYNEALINCLQGIEQLHLAKDHRSADVILQNGIHIPEAPIRPSGLGGQQLSAVSKLPYRPLCNQYAFDYIRRCADEMDTHAVKYAETGGIHCSALLDPTGILSLFEDIGRHNTLDKIAGDCLIRQISADDALLITSGRISSDMVRKASRLGVSVIASYSAPTEKAYELAKSANITLIGYLKKQGQIYCVEERIL